METEKAPPQLPRNATDEDRQAAAEALQRACGEGRLTLEEFSDRVGAVWAADRTDQIAVATADIQPAMQVGIRSVRHVVNIVGEQQHRGRWRMPAALRVINVVGEVGVDLRDVVITDPLDDGAVDIYVFSLVGSVTITVPEGVDVDVFGLVLVGSRTVHLAEVPRRPGTPLVRVHMRGLVGEIDVRSAPARR